MYVRSYKQYMRHADSSVLDFARRHWADWASGVAAWRRSSWESRSHANCEALFRTSGGNASDGGGTSPITLTVLGGSSSANVNGHAALLGQALEELTGRSVEVLNPSHGYSGSDFAALYLQHLVPSRTNILVWEMSTNDWPKPSSSSTTTTISSSSSFARTSSDSFASSASSSTTSPNDLEHGGDGYTHNTRPLHTEMFELFVRRALAICPRVIMLFAFLWQPRAAVCYPACRNDSLLWRDNLDVLEGPPYFSDLWVGGGRSSVRVVSPSGEEGRRRRGRRGRGKGDRSDGEGEGAGSTNRRLDAFAVDVNQLAKALALPTSRLFADKHHPTDQGHLLIAASLLRHLLPYISPSATAALQPSSVAPSPPSPPPPPPPSASPVSSVGAGLSHHNRNPHGNTPPHHLGKTPVATQRAAPTATPHPLDVKGAAQWARSRHCRVRVVGLNSARVRQACLRAEALDIVRAAQRNATRGAGGSKSRALSTDGSSSRHGANDSTGGSKGAPNRGVQVEQHIETLVNDRVVVERMRVRALVKAVKAAGSDGIRGVTFNPPAFGDHFASGGLHHVELHQQSQQSQQQHPPSDLGGSTAYTSNATSQHRRRGDGRAIRNDEASEKTWTPAHLNVSHVFPTRARADALSPSYSYLISGTVPWRGRVGASRRDRVHYAPLPLCTPDDSQSNATKGDGSAVQSALSFSIAGRARFVGFNVRAMGGAFDAGRRPQDERLLVSRHVISGPVHSDALPFLRIFVAVSPLYHEGTREGQPLAAAAEQMQGVAVVPFSREALYVGGAGFLVRGIFVPQVWAELPTDEPLEGGAPSGGRPTRNVVTTVRVCRRPLSMIERRAAEPGGLSEEGIQHVGSLGGVVFIS